ncbi:MAG: hypothetical protein HWN68_06680 [Desulfobacterales bacterium]|nr:hypothetical protein [Desulfobacterales bacterium]
MKRLLSIIVTIGFLTYPSICASSYLIRLRNGSEFIVYQYWKEGDQIKFYFYGGVVGIRKDFVGKITESDAAYTEETDSARGVTTETPSSKTAGGQGKEDGSGKKAAKNKKDKKVDVEKYKEKKRVLQAQLDDALKRVDEATMNKDPEAKKKAMEEMRAFAKQIYDLTDELKEKTNGVLPDDWWPDS